MRGIVIFLFVVLLCSSVFAWGGGGTIFTNGIYNGRFFYFKDAEESAKMSYVSGVVDCLSRLDPKKMTSLYASYTKDSLYTAVRDYYRNNPKDIMKPIVDVVLSGCK